jgi:hypothetical protein
MPLLLLGRKRRLEALAWVVRRSEAVAWLVRRLGGGCRFAWVVRRAEAVAWLGRRVCRLACSVRWLGGCRLAFYDGSVAWLVVYDGSEAVAWPFLGQCEDGGEPFTTARRSLSLVLSCTTARRRL